MTPRARLAQVLALLLAQACAVPELDDEVCLEIEPDQTCPDDREAREQLVGTVHQEACDEPQREVLATGALLTDFPTPDGTRECCYEAAYEDLETPLCVDGRPLRDEGEIVTARPTSRADWSAEMAPDLSGLTDAQKAALAEAWTRAGLLEHASVPAFARVALDLVALGAPAELLARVSQAMADEVEHARACFALASAYAGHPVGPGPLPLPGHRVPTLEALALETFEEGCVGETLAVAHASAQLEGATDEAVRRGLQQIIRDEARHADLAWDILGWAVSIGGERVKHLVLARRAELRCPKIELGGRTPRDVRGHGLADPFRVQEVLSAVWSQAVFPSAEVLLRSGDRRVQTTVREEGESQRSNLASRGVGLRRQSEGGVPTP